MNSLFGIPVYSSPFAVQQVPNRPHKKRRNQGEAYHRRVQKKWAKRFGTHEEKCAFLIGGKALSLVNAGGQDRLVVHPEHLALLRNIV